MAAFLKASYDYYGPAVQSLTDAQVPDKVQRGTRGSRRFTGRFTH